jgi:hypothetical protein
MDHVEAPAIDSTPARRLAFDEVIGAIYRLAFRRPGDHDIFGNAQVRWTDFVAPVLVILVIGLTYDIGSDRELRAAMNINLTMSIKVLGIMLGGLMLRTAIGLFVTFLITAPNVAPARVGAGMLAYAWTQAVLIVPWMILARTTLDPHGPVALEIALVVGMLFGIVFCSARVMQVAFAFSGLGMGVLIVLAGNFVSDLADRLLWAIIF